MPRRSCNGDGDANGAGGTVLPQHAKPVAVLSGCRLGVREGETVERLERRVRSQGTDDGRCLGGLKIRRGRRRRGCADGVGSGAGRVRREWEVFWVGKVDAPRNGGGRARRREGDRYGSGEGLGGGHRGRMLSVLHTDSEALSLLEDLRRRVDDARRINGKALQMCEDTAGVSSIQRHSAWEVDFGRSGMNDCWYRQEMDTDTD
jgi:hypothetical protein